MKRRIVPGGILALSLAVVLLAATASTASAASAFLYPTPLGLSFDSSFDFGDRQVGTTSPAQGFWLLSHENPRISVSGDYAQTNDCPPTRPIPAIGESGPTLGCLITVTFTPTGAGPKGGTLSTGPGGPTAALIGTGVTTPTPPALPLLLSAGANSRLLKRKVTLPTITNNDATVVATGGTIKKTTKQLAAGEKTKIKAKVKHLKRLKEEPTPPKINVKFAATDEFGQTATDEEKVKLCSRLIKLPHAGEACGWHPSRK